MADTPKRYRADDADMRSAGRTPESFAYRVVELLPGNGPNHATDSIYTDCLDDALNIARHMVIQGYNARIEELGMNR